MFNAGRVNLKDNGASIARRLPSSPTALSAGQSMSRGVLPSSTETRRVARYDASRPSFFCPDSTRCSDLAPSLVHRAPASAPPQLPALAYASSEPALSFNFSF